MFRHSFVFFSCKCLTVVRAAFNCFQCIFEGEMSSNWKARRASEREIKCFWNSSFGSYREKTYTRKKKELHHQQQHCGKKMKQNCSKHVTFSFFNLLKLKATRNTKFIFSLGVQTRWPPRQLDWVRNRWHFFVEVLAPNKGAIKYNYYCTVFSLSICKISI